MHPDDVRELAVTGGGWARITSRSGSVEARVEVTDDVARGSVCLPHGWGHRVGVDGAANGVGGPNYNTLTRAGAAHLEPLAGMSVLNGIGVRVEALPTG